jgi:hypothetical protein
LSLWRTRYNICPLLVFTMYVCVLLLSFFIFFVAGLVTVQARPLSAAVPPGWCLLHGLSPVSFYLLVALPAAGAHFDVKQASTNQAIASL